MDLNLYFDLSVSPDNLYQKNEKIEIGEHGISKIGDEYFATTFHLKGGGGRGNLPVAKGDILLWIIKGGEHLIWNSLGQKARANSWPRIKYEGSSEIQKYSLTEVYKLFQKETHSVDDSKEMDEIPDRKIDFNEYSNSELANEIELFFKSKYFSKRLQIAHIRMIIEWQFKVLFTEKFINSESSKNEILQLGFGGLIQIFKKKKFFEIMTPLSITFKRKKFIMRNQLEEHRDLGNYFIHFSKEDTTISNLTADDEKYEIMIAEAGNTIKNLYHIYKEVGENEIEFNLIELIDEKEKGLKRKI